jgi:hypothetical protein
VRAAIEQLTDTPNDIPAIGVYDLGQSIGYFDGGFQTFQYRMHTIVGFLGADRQNDPNIVGNGRFSVSAEEIVPRGIVRETMVGRWLHLSRTHGYSNLSFHPKHHDVDGDKRGIPVNSVVIIDEEQQSTEIASNLFEKLERDMPLTALIVVGEAAVSSFLKGLSEANELQKKRVMPFYQAGYYLINADSDLRSLATMAYMSGLANASDSLPDEHRYRVLMNVAWSIVNNVVATRSRIDYFDEQLASSTLPDLSIRGAVDYIVNHPFRALIRGFEQNIYYQLEPILGAYDIKEDELLESCFRLWLAHNYYLEIPRGIAPFERDGWGNLYEGEKFFKWAELFHVPSDDEWADIFAANLSPDQLNKYRSVVRATVLAAIGRDFSNDIPELYGWHELIKQDIIERTKSIHRVSKKSN